jgi:hypothetical protein
VRKCAGSARSDHRDQLVLELGEGALERDLPLPPGQGDAEQLVGIGADAQPGPGGPAAQRGDHERHDEYKDGTPPAGVDQPDEEQAIHARGVSRAGGKGKARPGRPSSCATRRATMPPVGTAVGMEPCGSPGAIRRVGASRPVGRRHPGSMLTVPRPA